MIMMYAEIKSNQIKEKRVNNDEGDRCKEDCQSNWNLFGLLILHAIYH